MHEFLGVLLLFLLFAIVSCLSKIVHTIQCPVVDTPQATLDELVARSSKFVSQRRTTYLVVFIILTTNIAGDEHLLHHIVYEKWLMVSCAFLVIYYLRQKYVKQDYAAVVDWCSLHDKKTGQGLDDIMVQKNQDSDKAKHLYAIPPMLPYLRFFVQVLMVYVAGIAMAKFFDYSVAYEIIILLGILIPLEYQMWDVENEYNKTVHAVDEYLGGSGESEDDNRVNEAPTR